MSKKLTTAEFIERARAKHGDRYDYSKTVYRVAKEPVAIICPEHGEFLQKPDTHYSSGCPRCAGKGVTTAEFIERARAVHGDWYDYSEVEYLGKEKEVRIRCPEHGWFMQKAGVHRMGSGCFECGLIKISKKKRKTLETFLRQAREIHGDRFDYSKVDYQGVEKKVTVICQEHGEFRQTPSVHVSNKAGCPACGGVPRYGRDGFIERARKAHGDKYKYSEVAYKNARTKAKILCPDHGPFLQEPFHHIVGIGCPDCGNEKIRDAQLKSVDQFILDAAAIHGDRYDYSLVEYSGSKDNVTIICPEHGPFQQLPPAHLQGSGCPSCAESGIDLEAPGILYYLRVESEDDVFWKIGITNRSVENRFKGDFKNITVLETWYFAKLREGFEREKQILRNFAHLRYRGDQVILNRGGNTELFVEDVLMLDAD